MAASDPPTLDTLLRLAFAQADVRPDQVALHQLGRGVEYQLGVGGRQLTYREFRDRVRHLAAGLIGRGMRPGDAAVYAVRPGIDSLVHIAALQLAGASVVAVDPGVGPELFARRVAMTRPRWVVAESIIYAGSTPGPVQWAMKRAGLELPNLHALDATFVRVGAWMPGVPASVSSEELIAEGARRPVPLGTHDPDRPVLVIFTSGTTSEPKGVEHTARTLGAACGIVAELCALSPGDVVYSTQTHQMLTALMAGATCVIPPLRVKPERLLEDLRRYRVTHTYAVPFEMAELVKLLEQRGERLPSRLRNIVLGSAPILRPFLRRLRAVCSDATDIWCVYAMTEMLPTALVESREKLAWEGEGDLVGRPIAGARVEVAEDGELFVTGPNLCRRYLGQEPMKLHATGDLGRLDEEGRVVLLGRKKDMIIRGHFNIYPPLYEEAIGAIDGVDRCAMVGVPTEDAADERVVLAVQPLPGHAPEVVVARVERALRDGTCAIDRYALPDGVFACALPHAGRSRKLDRPALERMAAEWLRGGGHAAEPAGDAVERERLAGHRVAVTGASGFLGGRLARRLVALGAEVHGFGRRSGAQVDLPGVHYRSWDIVKGPLADAPEVDVVIHCAGTVTDWGPRALFEGCHVDGTHHVLASFPASARVVHVSSASVYDPHRPKVDVREDAPLPSRYLNDYAETKATAERIVGRRADSFILRPHAIYGPGDTVLLPRILAAHRMGRLLAVGDGSNHLSLTHVDNLVDAIVLAIEAARRGDPGGVFNVADAEPYRLDDALHATLRAHGLPPRILYVPREVGWRVGTVLETGFKLGRVPRAPRLTRYIVAQLASEYTLDLRRARERLGYAPTRTLYEFLGTRG